MKLFFFLLFLHFFKFGISQNIASKADFYTELPKSIKKLKDSGDINKFITRAKKVKVKDTSIDSIIYAKLLFDHEIKELKKNHSESNKSLLLTIVDKKHDKTYLLNSYRKKISSILSKDQFAYIYQDLLNSQINLETNEIISDLKNEYTIENISKLTKSVNEFVSEAVLEQQYYAYDKRLSTRKYESILFDGLKKHRNDLVKSYNKKTDTIFNQFIEKGKSLNIISSKINDIIEAHQIKTDKIKHLKATNKSTIFSVRINEKNQNSTNGPKNEFKERVNSILTFDEYKLLFENQFTSEIERKTSIELSKIKREYEININQVLEVQNYIKQYVTNDVMFFNYYSFDNDLAKEKLRTATFKFDANGKNLFNQKIKSFNLTPLASGTTGINKELIFREKAIDVGITAKITDRIINAARIRDEKILEIKIRDKQTKNKDIYLLESGTNNRKTIRNNFKKTLSELITIEQFGKLFNDQLLNEIEKETQNHIKKVNSVYKLNDNQQEALLKLTKKNITQKVLLTHYYSFDNNLKKKKLKVAKFKFDTEYKKLIKEFIN